LRDRARPGGGNDRQGRPGRKQGPYQQPVERLSQPQKPRRRTRMSNKTIALAVAAALLAGTAHAQGISGDVVKIGIMNGASGPYAAISGKGSVVAAQMAVEDFGGKVLGKPVQILSADHQNKPDIGSAVAREWIDREGVDMIADMDTSSVALAVQRLATDKCVLTINT